MSTNTSIHNISSVDYRLVRYSGLTWLEITFKDANGEEIYKVIAHAQQDEITVKDTTEDPE